MLYHLAPSELRFLQNSIADRFSDDCVQSLEETFLELLYGSVRVDDIKNLSTVEEDDSFWIVSGNRRLYLYKRLEHYGLLSTVPVHVVAKDEEKFNAMKTTRNDGRKVAVRSDRLYPVGNKMADRLDRIYKQWKSAGRPRDGQLPVYDVTKERDGWTSEDDCIKKEDDDDQYSDYCDDFDETSEPESEEEEVQLEDRVDLLDDIDYSNPDTKDDDDDDEECDDDDNSCAAANCNQNTRGRRGAGEAFRSRGPRGNKPYNLYQGNRVIYNQYANNDKTRRGDRGRVSGRGQGHCLGQGRGRGSGQGHGLGQGRGRGSGQGRGRGVGRGGRRDDIDPTGARDTKAVNYFTNTSSVPSLMNDIRFSKEYELSMTGMNVNQPNFALHLSKADFSSSAETVSSNRREINTSGVESTGFIRGQDLNSNVFTSPSTRNSYELPVSGTRENVSDLIRANMDFPGDNSRDVKVINNNLDVRTSNITVTGGLCNQPVAPPREGRRQSLGLNRIETSKHSLGTSSSASPPPLVSYTQASYNPAPVKLTQNQISTDTRVSVSSPIQSASVRPNINESSTKVEATLKKEELVSSQASGQLYKTKDRDSSNVDNSNHSVLYRNTQSNAAASVLLAEQSDIGRLIRQDSLTGRQSTRRSNDHSDQINNIALPTSNVSFTELWSGLDKVTKSYIETYPPIEKFEMIKRMRTDSLYRIKIEKQAAEVIGHCPIDNQEIILEQANILRRIKLEKSKQDRPNTPRSSASGYPRSTDASQHAYGAGYSNPYTSPTTRTYTTTSSLLETEYRGISKSNNLSTTARDVPSQTPSNSGLPAAATTNPSGTLKPPTKTNNIDSSSSKCIIS